MITRVYKYAGLPNESAQRDTCDYPKASSCVAVPVSQALATSKLLWPSPGQDGCSSCGWAEDWRVAPSPGTHGVRQC